MRAALLLLGLAACDGGLQLYLQPPPGDAGAVLYLVELAHPRLERRLFAVAAEDRHLALALTEETTPSPDHRVVAFLLPQSLEDLQLDAGEHLLSEGSESRPLPRAAAVLEARLSSPPGAWRPLDPVPSELSALRIVDRRQVADLCRPFHSVRITLGTQLEIGNVELATALDDRRALVLTTIGKVLLVDDLTSAELPHLSALGQVRNLFARADGAIYLVTRAGALLRGRVESGLEMVAQAQVEPRADWWIDGSVDGPLELYLGTRAGAFLRYADGALEVLDDRSDGASSHVPVRRIRAGEAFAAGLRARTLSTYRQGVVSEEPSPEADGDEVHAATSDGGLGRVLGTARGRFYHDASGRWALLGGADAGLITRAVIPYDGGLLAGGNFGLYARYHPRSGWCTPQALGSSEIRALVRLAPGVLAAVDTQGPAEDPTVFWLR